MKRKTIIMALWFCTVATTVFADLGPPTQWGIDTRTLDDYHYFLYNGGHYISLNFLMAAIGVLCVAFLAWRLRKDQCGTWFATLRALLLILLRVVSLGLVGVLLLVSIMLRRDVDFLVDVSFLVFGVLCVVFLAWRLRKDQCGTWFATLRVLLFSGLSGVLLFLYVICMFSTFGGNPLFYLDVPWNRAAYDRRCIECYESNGREYARRSGAVDRPIEPRKNAPAEVQEAYDRYIGTGWRRKRWESGQYGPISRQEKVQGIQTEKFPKKKFEEQ